MKEKLDCRDEEEIQLDYFDMNIEQTAWLIEREIIKMERNKAVGIDLIYAEMMKAHTPAVAATLSRCWQTIGKQKVMPKHWVEGTIVPLFKGKGSMGDPRNFRPL